MCTTEEQLDGTVCTSQTSRLLKIGILIVAMQLTAPVLGFTIDKIGAKWSAYLQALCFFIGILFSITATATLTSWLLYVGFGRLGRPYGYSESHISLLPIFVALVGIMSISTFMASLLIVQLGLYFSGHTISRVIFSLNTVFDGGTITYLALFWIQKWTVTTTTIILVSYLVVAILVFGGALYYWTVAVPASQTNDESIRSDSMRFSTRHSRLEVMLGQDQDMDEMLRQNIGVRISQRFSITASMAAGSSSILDNSAHPSSSFISQSFRRSRKSSASLNEKQKTGSTGGKGARIEETLSVQPKDTRSDYVLVADRDGKKQLTSGAFLSLCLFFALHCGMCSWNLATQRDFLANLGDDDHDNLYLTVFTLLTPVSILGAPFVDLMILNFGWSASFHMINVLSLGYMLVKVTSTSLNVQIVGFVIFSFYRSFLYGICFSFLPTIIGGSVVGLAAGMMSFSAGLVNVLEIPLVNVALNDSNDGDFLIPNLVFLALTVPTVACVCLIGRYIRLERMAKDQKDDVSSTNIKAIQRNTHNGVLEEEHQKDMEYELSATEVETEHVTARLSI